MEVHHHSHTADPGMHRGLRKKWSHYFWEFIMLFLAVFCGFLAENQREHYIEHQREKQYIRSLYNDIKADTMRLGNLIENRTSRESWLDSLTSLLNSDTAEQVTKDIYFWAVSIPRVQINQFTPHEGTMQQLKNAGGLRLIRKHGVADSIMNYDAAIRSLLRFDQQEQEIINIYRETGPKIFDGIELSKLSDQDNNPIRIQDNPRLMSGYRNILNEWNYRLVSVKNVNKGYRRESKKLLKQAINLLNILKQEYHLR